MKRVARLADNRTFPKQLARLTALRFLAALTTRLGPERVAPFLPAMLKPLFRITEGLNPNPEEVHVLHFSMANLSISSCVSRHYLSS